MLTPTKPNDVVCQRQTEIGNSLTKSLQVNSYLVNSGKQFAAGKFANGNLKKIFKLFVLFLLAGLSGCVEVFFSYPTEYVKVVLQLDERSAKPRYKGVVDVVKQTFAQHGPLGVYRGFSVVLLGAFPKYMFR